MDWQSTNVTELLGEWQNGRKTAANAVFGLVYADLVDRAGLLLFKRGIRQRDITPRTLLHDSYERIGRQRNEFKSRDHFFALCSDIMREILRDKVRAMLRQKRGGDWRKVPLSAVEANDKQRTMNLEEYVDFDNAVEELHRHRPDLAKLAFQKIVLGMTIDEITEGTGLPRSTVAYRISTAKKYLRRSMSP